MLLRLDGVVQVIEDPESPTGFRAAVRRAIPKELNPRFKEWELTVPNTEPPASAERGSTL
jgi:hypothetical protein